MLKSLPTLLAAAALGTVALASTACVGDAPTFGGGGDVQPDAGPVTDAEAVKKQFEDEVEPVLNSFCVGCHGAETSVPFMAPDPDVYTAVMEWPNLISLKVPASSSLLSKGAHAGPAFTPEQTEIVRAWIDAEALLAPEDEGVLETPPFIPVQGDNNVDLSSVGLTGASLSFRLESLANGMYMSRMAISAGNDGIRIVHPTFVPWEGDVPNPDPVDRFSAVDMFIEPLQSASLGGGTLILVDVPSNAPISIRFETAETAEQGDNVLQGCLDVESFTANAQPQLQQYCTSCHAGSDNSATNATDMTRIADLSAAGQEAACGQILSRVNLGDPVNSSIFLAPEPGSNLGHPYKLPNNQTFTAFRTALLNWITAEQNAAAQQ